MAYKYHALFCWPSLLIIVANLQVATSQDGSLSSNNPPSIPEAATSIPETSILPTTEVFTSVVTPPNTAPGELNTPVTVVVTRVNDGTLVPVSTEINSDGTRITSYYESTSSVPLLYTYTKVVPSVLVGTVGEGDQPTSTSTSPADRTPSSGLSAGTIAAVSICATLAVILSLAVGWFLVRRRREQRSVKQSRTLSEAVLPAEKDGNLVGELSSTDKPNEVEGIGINESYVLPAELEGDGPAHFKSPGLRRGRINPRE